MKQRPAQRKHRMFLTLELQLVVAAELVALGGVFQAKQPEPRGRLGDRVVARIGDADHQRRRALMRGHDRMFGKHEARPRPRKAGEDQSGHHREETHAGEDFHGRDEVAVIGLRMHVAVADRGERLDREIEKLQRAVAGNVRDRVIAERIEQSECGVEQDEDRRGGAEEHRPIDRHRAVIEIGPESAGQSAGFDLAGADMDDTGSALAFWRCRFASLCRYGIALTPHAVACAAVLVFSLG